MSSRAMPDSEPERRAGAAAALTTRSMRRRLAAAPPLPRRCHPELAEDPIFRRRSQEADPSVARPCAKQPASAAHGFLPQDDRDLFSGRIRHGHYCLARMSLPRFSISARASLEVILPEKTACRSGVTTLSLISWPPGPSCHGCAYAPAFRYGSRSLKFDSHSDSSDLRDGIASPSDVHFFIPSGPVR